MSTLPLVSTEWLAEHLGDAEVKVLDATFFLPGQGDARATYLAGHVPGAAFFDLEAVADPDNPLPHMLPSPEAFGAAMGALGIGNDDHVVAYGLAGPRAWWMFRAMGHDKVSVLDGGVDKWKAEGRPTEAGEAKRAPKVFTAHFRPELVTDTDGVRADLAAGKPVVDARSPSRFRGDDPEPRPGVQPGHMPGATNLSSATLFNPDGTWKGAADTADLLDAANAGLDRAVTATCGSGVTACMIALARARLGRWDTVVYDGSWTEWGSRPDTPKAKG